MKYSYTKQEENELESQWWEHMVYDANKEIMDTKRKEYADYQGYLEMPWKGVFIGRYGEKTGLTIAKLFDSIVTQDPWSGGCYYYSDNYRVALKDNLDEVKEYKRAQKKGCCGFFDEEYVINNKTYLIGFNYGH